MSPPCVLVVADPPRIAELVAALSEPLSVGGAIDVVIGSGGDDTVDLFTARRPAVVVLTATLETGDSKALIDAVRSIGSRREVAIVVVGDDASGSIRTALDAMDLEPDRFVNRPLAAKALRQAVSNALEAVQLARGDLAPSARLTAPGIGVAVRAPAPPQVVTTTPAAGSAGGSASTSGGPPRTISRPELRARWEALADSIGNRPAPASGAMDLDAEWPSSSPSDPGEAAPPREPTLILREPSAATAHDVPLASRVDTADGWPVQTGPAVVTPGLRAPARRPARESEPPIAVARTSTLDRLDDAMLDADPIEAFDAEAPDAIDSVIVAERRPGEGWSRPQPLPEISDRDSRRDIHPASVDELGLDDFDDDIGGREPPDDLAALGELSDSAVHLAPAPGGGGPSALITDRADRADRSDRSDRSDRDRDHGVDPEPLAPPPEPRRGGRDFARELRAKMSQMAQRLFQGDADAAPAAGPADHAPRHDHHTHIDLASLGEEPAVGSPSVTEIARVSSRPEDARGDTAPGAWDTQVRERGLPDAGELARGTADAALLLARMFAQKATGRITFARDGGDHAGEKVVYFDGGRPVFASSNAPGDRMGELLVREGKITAAQYERCQTHVAQSGRRMGEILVDFGYLKRRELLPAVRRHVEDIIYSLFGWDRGRYAIAVDPVPSTERIRLSRHPASLVLEGIRRKLDRTTLDKLVGPPSTVIEVPDREKLGGIVNVGDLATEERAALAAFDGQADLAAVARAAAVDLADVLPFAWGLCVLGLATARRAEADAADDGEGSALVGETDLAIDRERVRARWQLVTEADYFALLGVRRDATAFEIRRAYQGARRDFAADCFPQDLRRELAHELDDIAQVLDEAFRVLRDDRLRLTYLHNLVE